ncbi:MAG: hypothetical protein WDZ59_16035 [Pirellulales bacterium]
MKFKCKAEHRTDGTWHIRHDSPDLGQVQATAGSREAALEKMRGELRYRLELCPCTGESYQHLEIELVE